MQLDTQGRMAELERAARLMQKGFEYLESHDYDMALDVGRELEQMRHSSAFEIMALAYEGKEDLDKAVSVLERGTSLAPTVWVLWGLLGNFHSESSQWEESQRCYSRALACPDVDASSVCYNSAVALLREGQCGAALERVDRVVSQPLQLKAAGLRVEILTRLGRYQEAMAFAEDALKRLPSDATDERSRDEAEGIASIYASSAEAARKQGDRKRALRLAWEAIRVHKQQTKAAWLIRELEERTSPEAKSFLLTLEGTWPVPSEGETELPGFLTIYHVLARTPDEAVDFARRFERQDVRDTLEVHRCEALSDEPGQPMGVCSATGYIFFPRVEGQPEEDSGADAQ